MDVSLFGKMEKLKGISEERIMRIALRIDMKTPPRATVMIALGGVCLILQNFLLVDRKTKAQAEALCCLATQKHTPHKDLKVIHNGAVFGFNR